MLVLDLLVFVATCLLSTVHGQAYNTHNIPIGKTAAHMLLITIAFARNKQDIPCMMRRKLGCKWEGFF